LFLGLTVPDKDLKWDEKTNSYQFGDINWDEFWTVVKGDGPCNKDRIQTRIKAYQEGEWVREAAMAYADKQQERSSKMVG